MDYLGLLDVEDAIEMLEEGDELMDTTVGIHHFRKRHNVRAGLEYRWGDSPDQVLLGFQILI